MGRGMLNIRPVSNRQAATEYFWITLRALRRNERAGNAHALFEVRKELILIARGARRRGWRNLSGAAVQALRCHQIRPIRQDRSAA